MVNSPIVLPLLLPPTSSLSSFPGSFLRICQMFLIQFNVNEALSLPIEENRSDYYFTCRHSLGLLIGLRGRILVLAFKKKKKKKNDKEKRKRSYSWYRNILTLFLMSPWLITDTNKVLHTSTRIGITHIGKIIYIYIYIYIPKSIPPEYDKSNTGIRTDPKEDM